MSADEVDPIAGVTGYLAAVPEVVALAAEFGLDLTEFVMGGELAPDASDAMPRPAVVLTEAGGPGSPGTVPLGRQRIDVRNYGRTASEASRIARVVHNALRALHRQVVGAVFLHSAEPSGGYNAVREPVVRWPLTLRTYLVLYDEREVV